MDVESKTRRVLFRRIPEAEMQTSDFEVDSVNLTPSRELKYGELLVQNIYVSLDPAMRARMRPESIKSYTPAYKIDHPIESVMVGRIIISQSPHFEPDDLVLFEGPIQERVIVHTGTSRVRKLDTSIQVPPSLFLGILGHTGLTAYVGLFDIGQPKAGETIYVSSAAGAVGSVVCQLAKNIGMHVVGSAGSDEKVEFLVRELGVDYGFNYRKGSLRSHLVKGCPNGIDVYFEQVGGQQLEVALPLCNDFARIPVCGMISQYNVGYNERFGVRNLPLLTTKRIKMQGFIVTDHFSSSGPAVAYLAKLLKEGKLKYKEHIVASSIENVPEALLGLFSGENFGKAIVQLSKL